MPDSPQKPVRKQLIVVVHGVGIRSAGESSDLVAAALNNPSPVAADGEGGAQTAGFRRRASDDFLLFETAAGDDSRLAQPYPARLTRFRRFGGPFPGETSPERVICDFYWGDVGGFAASVPSVLVGLGRIMLGLAHVVRENALTVFPDLTSRRAAAWRGLARGAALAIHGPIFALNIALLIGLAWIVLVGHQTAWVSVLTALACLALAGRLQAASRSFLLRHMGGYLALVGLFLLAFATLDLWSGGPVALPVVDAAFREALCSWKTEALATDCATAHGAGPFLHAMRLQGLMVLIWSGVALVTLVFGLRWLVSLARRDPTSRSDLLMPTLSLMTLLWFLLIGLGWAGIAALYGQIGPGILAGGEITARAACGLAALPQLVPCDGGGAQSQLFTTSLRGIWSAVATLAVLVVVGAGFLAWRHRAVRRLSPASYMAAADRNADRIRMVVAGPVRLALLVMPVLILALIAASTFLARDLCFAADSKSLFCRLETSIGPVLATAVAAIVALAPVLMRPLSLGINVAGDVIIYLNDFHWRRAPQAAPSRTFAELAVPGLVRMRRKPLHPSLGYAYRIRIQKRLRSLVQDLILTEEPDRIDFVCHSQGTVITLDVLATKGGFWGRGRHLTLVTMGSPWRHLYHRYFGHAFADLAEAPAGVDRWTNIFRIDDFIGTHVRAGSDDEQPVGPGGHTNYWRDSAVRQILQDRLDG